MDIGGLFAKLRLSIRVHCFLHLVPLHWILIVNKKNQLQVGSITTRGKRFVNFIDTNKISPPKKFTEMPVPQKILAKCVEKADSQNFS